MKRIATAIMLSILMLSGCATTAQNSEAVIAKQLVNAFPAEPVPHY